MPFIRPDLPTLINRAQADMDSRLAGSPYLRRRLMAVVARMEGGVAHGLYGYLDWLALQIMPDTAEVEHLNRWATIWGIHRKAATRAGGYASLSGQSGSLMPSGLFIPAGTLLQSMDGVHYVVLADTPLKNGTALVPLEAVISGFAGNVLAGAPLQLTAPLPGVNAQGVTVDGLSGGADEETDAALRVRLLARIRTQPSGGAAQDYVTWALSVPGVTRAWCYPGEMGRGSVTVRFVMDNSYANGIPQTDDVARVATYIESVRPVTADVYVVAPVPQPIHVDLRIVPDTPRTRFTVEQALWAALRREAVPGGIVVISRLNEAISLAEGEDDHTLLAPTQNVHLPTGCIAVPGVIHWGDV